VLSRAAGAPTLAVGMAQDLSSLFEAGTRVAGFMIQELLGRLMQSTGASIILESP